MIYYKADKISFSYENQAENILSDISFSIDGSSKIGIIGKNGSGKTTLFKLLLSELKPNGGTIYKAKKIRVGYLSQKLIFASDATLYEYLMMTKPRLKSFKNIIDNSGKYSNAQLIEAIATYDELDGYEFENRIEKTAYKFGFDNEYLYRKISSLSGGEKSKLAICRIMLNNPNILLWDEPTNHLDINAVMWIEKYLKSIKIPFLLISHDRKFLDNCVTKVWEIDKGKLRQFSGNYSFYKSEKKIEEERNIHLYAQNQKKITQLKNVYHERRQWALSYQAQTGKDGYAPVFEMLTNPAKSAMRRAKSIQTRLEKEIENIKKPWIEKKRKIIFEESPLRSRIVLQIENLSKSYEDKNIFKNIKLSVKNAEKLLIKGKNGSGKSTLFKIIIGKIIDFTGNYKWSPQVKIGYYAQEFENLNPERTIIEEVAQNIAENQTKARTLLGSLNIRGDKVLSKIKDLSMGEKSKTALAKLLSSDANVYILDEPINHLEIASREALEKALLNYAGTVIFVSHDRYFNDKIADRSIDLDEFDKGSY